VQDQQRTHAKFKMILAHRLYLPSSYSMDALIVGLKGTQFTTRRFTLDLDFSVFTSNSCTHPPHDIVLITCYTGKGVLARLTIRSRIIIESVEATVAMGP